MKSEKLYKEILPGKLYWMRYSGHARSFSPEERHIIRRSGLTTVVEGKMSNTVFNQRLKSIIIEPSVRTYIVDSITT
jgi:hypothetical protein